MSGGRRIEQGDADSEQLTEAQWGLVFEAASQCRGMSRGQVLEWLARQGWPEALCAAFGIHLELGEPPDDPDRQRAGEQVGTSIELRAHLRDGGAGSVYLGVHERAGRYAPVAVKLLSLPQKEEGRHALKEAWLREQRWLRELRGSGWVAPFVEAGEHSGSDGSRFLYLCTEYKHGRTLRRWCAEHALDAEARVQLFFQVCDAVAAIHGHGLVHGDLKPDNIQVQAREGRASVWLLDLGLTAIQGQPWPAHGQLLGTPGYMAPEQIDARHGVVGEATDVYALGLILFELLEGRPWLDGRGVTTASELEARIRSTPPVRITQPMPAALRERLNGVLQRATAQDVAQRFTQVSALRQALEQAIASAVQGQRARRRVLAFALPIAALAALAGVALVRSAAPGVCSGLDAPMTAVWNSSTRGQMQAAFRATGLSFAADAYAAADAALTSYAGAWAAARTDACEATHVRGDQSAQLMDLRMACLGRRRAEVAQLVDELLAPDADAVARSLEAARRLPKLDECADSDALLARLPLPTAPDTRVAVDALDADLVRIKSLTDVGRYRDALPLAGAALERAQQLAYAPAIAEAHYRLGRLRVAVDDQPGARAALTQAVLYADAGRDDRLRLEAYLELIALDDGLLSSADAVAQAIQHAEQLVIRIGNPPLARARLHGAQSISADSRGRYALAIEHAEQALKLRREHLPANDPEIAESLSIYAYPLQESGRRTQARDVIREALAIARASLGAKHPRVGEMLLRASSTHGLLDQQKEALEFAQEALALFTEVYGPRHSKVAAAWTALGSVYGRAEKYSEAIAAYDTGLRIAQQVEGPCSYIQARLLTNKALYLRRLDRFEEAEAAGRSSVECYAKTRGPDHPETGAATGRVGAVLAERALKAKPGPAQKRDREEALALFERAVVILRKTSPDHPRLLDQIRGIAYLYEDLGTPRLAVPWLEEGLRISERSEESPVYTGYLRFTAGRVFWASGYDRPRADRLSLEARELFLEMGREDNAAAVDEWLRTRKVSDAGR